MMKSREVMLDCMFLQVRLISTPRLEAHSAITKGEIENVRPLSDNGRKPGSSPVQHVALISGAHVNLLSLSRCYLTRK